MQNALIKYHGGKSRLAAWIISMMPPHSLYVEPFGGGGSVLLAKQPAKSEVYNDLDGEIVNLFKMVRERGEELAAKIYLTPYAREEMELAYKPTNCQMEKARRFFIRAHMVITTTSIYEKSGFRTAINSKDYCSQFLTWFKTPETILYVRERLKNVAIENTDAFKLLLRFDKPKTLFYLDPPYLNITRGAKSIKKGYAHNLTDGQHLELLNIVKKLKGFVMISGYENELYDNELRGWRREENYSFDDRVKKRKEILWMNFNQGMQTKIDF